MVTVGGTVAGTAFKMASGGAGEMENAVGSGAGPRACDGEGGPGKSPGKFCLSNGEEIETVRGIQRATRAAAIHGLISGIERAKIYLTEGRKDREEFPTLAPARPTSGIKPGLILIGAEVVLKGSIIQGRDTAVAEIDIGGDGAVGKDLAGSGGAIGIEAPGAVILDFELGENADLIISSVGGSYK